VIDVLTFGYGMSESTTNRRQSWNEQVIANIRSGEPNTDSQVNRSLLLLLTTTGARSGTRRTTPLAHFADGDRLVIVASYGGADKNPAWFFNILADPHVTIERWDGEQYESFEAVAVVTEGSERDRLFARMVGLLPTFADYEKKTSRLIPVVALERV
jgi:deazaflavin-dependent oxidoreductase (nitroreductase family)